ncbi:MAG: hypothetical protein ACKVX7_06815 [Planctomycetota bacterium]
METLGVTLIGLTALSFGLAVGWYFGGRLDRSDASVIRRKTAAQTALWQHQLIEAQAALAEAESLVAARASDATAEAKAAMLTASLADVTGELDASRAQCLSLSKEITEQLATIGELEEEALASQKQLKLEAKRQQELMARLETEKSEIAERLGAELKELRATVTAVPVAAAAEERVATLESQLAELTTRLSAQEHDWQQLFEEQNREVQALTTELQDARRLAEERSHSNTETAARTTTHEHRTAELERELRALADENAQLKASQSGFLQELETRDEQIIKFRAKLIELMRPAAGDETDESDRERPAAVRTVTTDESDWELDVVIDDEEVDDDSPVERRPSRLRVIEEEVAGARPNRSSTGHLDATVANDGDVATPPPAESPRRAARSRAKRAAPNDAAIHQPELLLDDAQVAVEAPPLIDVDSQAAEDDLTLLPGIGSGLARKLRTLGFVSFERLAKLSAGDGAELANKLGSLFRRNHSVAKLIEEAKRRTVDRRRR